METWIIHVAIAIWWSMAVAVLAVLAKDDHSLSEVVAISVFWPLVAVLSMPALLWRSAVASTKAIRVDLKNRGLLREFEQWRKERNQ